MVTNIKKKPALFGIVHSNRDFTQKGGWGKNQFNTSFPAALVCYMESKDIHSVYLTLDKTGEIYHDTISAGDLFGLDCTSEELFFAFERDYAPYQIKIINELPRIDLVTLNSTTSQHLQGLEVKLTALPDNSTCTLTESLYGAELVIRPDTIVYLALSLSNPSTNFEPLLDVAKNIRDWTDEREMLEKLPEILLGLEKVIASQLKNQTPLILQPVWKTKGKSSELADNCLDSFVWSNLGFTRLFVDATHKKLENSPSSITRQMRTTLWLAKMLFDYSQDKQINTSWVIDKMTYNTKNDKAFSVNGGVTQPYMSSEELTNPRISKSEIKNIILYGGHKLLSPERRFDAIIFYSSHLFD